MPRPRLVRNISYSPRARYFKPLGVPMRFLEVVELTLEEAEALRLKYVEGFDQINCAKKMNTSQSTFQRILSVANKKIAMALTLGKAIKIIQ